MLLELSDDSGEPVVHNQGYVFIVSKMPGKVDEEISDNVIKKVLKK